MAGSGETVLLVEDDDASAASLRVTLEESGRRVRVERSAARALESIEREVPCLVIAAIEGPGGAGLHLITEIRTRRADVPVIALSPRADVPTIVDVVQRGAVDYLVKPVPQDALLAAVRGAFARSPRPAAGTAHPEVAEIVGTSDAAVAVRRAVVLASSADVNVVIVGDTGTGKELVARAIHRLSGKAPGRFVAHNCALTAPELFDSEMFGHSRGAFTGAHRARTGLLREADGGTLFLDELECLSLSHQAKLLRVLDNGEVRPVGAEEAEPVSVRFLAATNRSPDAMIAAGELREDLYYRLRGFEVHLPPLRERLADIAPLAAHFLRARGKQLTARAAQRLERCAWPGNVRQLRNVLHRAASVAPGDRIDEEHLDVGAVSPAAGAAGSSRPPPRGSRPPPDDVGRLEAIERAAIVRALDLHGGNRTRAAESLGIHRSTLRRKLRELDLERRR
jgi:DNA-binding NtrC family response regulator